MRTRALPSAEPARQVVTLSQQTWREQLAQELIAVGVGHDQAGLVARRVIANLTQRLGRA